MSAIATALLIVVGAVLFAVGKDSPRDFSGFVYLLVPLIGGAAALRSLSGGLAAAALALGLGYVIGIVLAIF